MKHRTLWGWVACLLIAGCSKAPPPAPPPPPSVTLVPAAEKSPHFDAVNRHLELGGELYGYADVDGDVDALAAKVKLLIAQFGKSVPQLADAGKVDPKLYLEALGFDDLKAFGFSSVAEQGGDYRNRFFLYLPNGRHGIFAATGGPAGPAKYLDLAPSNADAYEEIDFDVPALASAIKQAWLKSGATDAEAKFEQNLAQSGQAAGVSLPDLIRHLSGRMVVVMTVDPTKTITVPAPKPFVLPAFKLLLGIDGIGGDLQGILDRAPMLDHQVENGRRYYRPRMAMMVEGLRPAIAIVGTTLFFSTDEFFLHESLERKPRTGLSQNPDFQRLQAELGSQVNSLVYATPNLFEEIKRLPALNPDLDPSTLRVFDAAVAALPTVKRPLMEVLANTDDGILLRSRSYQSLKPTLAVMMVYPAIIAAISAKASAGGVYGAEVKPAPLPGVNPGGPMQAPGFNGPQGLSPDQRVRRNLRILSALANIYYRKSGQTTATYGDLIGPGKPIAIDLPPVEGEDYHSIKFEKGKPVQVTLPDGRVLTAPARAARPRPQPATAPSAP